MLFHKFQNTVEEGDHDGEVQENLRPHNQQLTKVKTEVCLRLKLYNDKGLEVHLFQMLDSINIVEPWLSLTQAPKSDLSNSQW